MAIVHRMITEEWIEDPEVESLEDGDCEGAEGVDEDDNGDEDKRRRG